jgi:hypothetical protein
MELLTRLDRVRAYLLRDLLLQHGVPAHVLNEHLQGAVGELPPDAALLQVWIERTADRDRARDLLARHERDRERTGARWCRHCGEENPPAFELCWRCGGVTSDP